MSGNAWIRASALIAGVALAGCNYSMAVAQGEGVPLAELDMSGAAPTALALAGPDRVIVSQGERLAIEVGGPQEAVDLLRFDLDADTLGIMRESGDRRARGTATVRVTMPGPRRISLAGSGNIEAASLSGEQTEANIAGSGTLRVARVATGLLDLNVMGSGLFEAAGEADRLNMNLAGSGSSKMGGLRVGSASINIAGSGDGEFDSDGTIEASIAGSGTVIVNGAADCSVNSVGSGRLVCRNARRSGADRREETATAE